MQAATVEIYVFDEKAKTLTLLRQYTNKDGMDLERPENICLSPDGTLFAISNMKNGKLHLYHATEGPPFFNPSPVCTIQAHKLHGVCFSPDGRFISYTGFGKMSWIYTSRLIQRNGKWKGLQVQKMQNPYEPLRPKSICFSPDGHFAAIGYCVELSRQNTGFVDGILATYHRNPETGLIDPAPISCIRGLTSLETVIFFPDASYILVTDQVQNRITGHFFNKITGELGGSWVLLQNPEAQINLCHGISVTSDGKFIAVTSTGDDKVTVYEMLPPSL